MSLSPPFQRDGGWESNTPPDLLLRVGDMSDEDDEDLDDCASSLAVLRVLTTRLARATMQVRCNEDPALLEDYLERVVADLRADAEALAALAQNAAASVPRGEARADTPAPEDGTAPIAGDAAIGGVRAPASQRLRGRLELTDDGDDTAFDGGETDGGRTLASRRRHGRLDPSDNEDDHDAAPASFERFFKLSATLPPTARTPEPQICNEKENLRGVWGGTPQARCRRHTAPRMCNE